MRAWAQNALELHSPFLGSLEALGLNAREEDAGKELDELYRQYKDLGDRIKQLEMQRTQRRAIHAPVRGVPHEVLGMIFCGIWHSFTETTDMLAIRLVCRKWNSVAINTPQLWTNIDTNKFTKSCDIWPREWAATWASRSKNHPLHVKFSFMGNMDLDHAFLSAGPILRALPRWSSFSLSGPASLFPRIFNRYINPKALRSLTLYLEESRSNDSPPASKQKRMFPLLEDLFLESDYLPRFEAPKLTCLNLSCVTMTCYEYSALSQDTPAVVKVTLRCVAIFMDSRGTLGSVDFHHTRLRSLTFEGRTRYCSTPNLEACTALVIHKIIAASKEFETFEIVSEWPWPYLQAESHVMKALPPHAKPAIKRLQLRVNLAYDTSEKKAEQPFLRRRFSSWLEPFSHVDTLAVGTIGLVESDSLEKAEMKWLRETSKTILELLASRIGYFNVLDLEEFGIMDGKTLCEFAKPLIVAANAPRMSFSKGTQIWCTDRYVQVPKDLWGTVDMHMFKRIIQQELPELWISDD
jgi:hypothetical protein